MYAVIDTGGKQARVEVGTRLEVELVSEGLGEEVTFSPVLVVEGEEVLAGASLEGVRVVGRVVGESKGPKIVGFTYKSKTRSRRRFGHRQHYTSVEITAIETAEKPPAPRRRTRAAASAS